MKRKTLLLLCSCFVIGITGCGDTEEQPIGFKGDEVQPNITPVPADSETKQDDVPISVCEHSYITVNDKASGKHYLKCTLCGLSDLVDHAFEPDVNKTDYRKEPTCTEAGYEWRVCSCGETIKADLDALGHYLSRVGNDSEPPEGEAKIDVFVCDRRCGFKFLTFYADEVSLNCKKENRTIQTVNRYGDHVTLNEPDYVENDDGSVQLYGRPIHNACNLAEGGVVLADLNYYLPAYDENIVGSFLEYKFRINNGDLDKEYKLIAEIKPGHNMVIGDKVFSTPRNNKAPSLKKDGDTISYYESRYVVTLDGVELEQNLDSDDNIVLTNEEKDWFTFPLVNNIKFLEEGYHVLRIAMGGGTCIGPGYCSSFYNFGFNPVD